MATTLKSYLFGGENMPKTPQELARMREMAERLAPSTSPDSIGEGISSIGQAILYRAMMNRADKAEKDGIAAADTDWNDAFGGLLRPKTDTSVSDVPTTSTSAKPSIKSPQDAVDASPQQPLTGDMAALENYIREGATKRRIDPNVAVRVARSEGLAPGVWQSRVKKGDQYEPSFGPFQMLVGDGKTFPKGMGNDFMDATGLDPRDPKNANAMIDFALDTAKKDGWRQWYGAKNVGINRWDGINADQVASLDEGGPELAMLPKDKAVPAAIAAQSNMIKTANQPVPVADVPDGFEKPDPLQAKLVQVAQSDDYFPPSPRKVIAGAMMQNGTLDMNRAISVLNNPYLDKGKRAIAEFYIKQMLGEQEAEREIQRQRADPKYKMDLEKGAIELENLKHPKQAVRLTDEQEKAEGFDTTGVYERLPDGSTKVVQAPKERKTATVNGKVVDLDSGKVIFDSPEQVKPPSDVMEYEYAQKQGYTGTFQQWQMDNKKASAAQTSVTIGEGDKFYENLDKKNAETFAAMSDGGIQARAKLGQIDRLEALFSNAPQGVEGALKKIAGDWGVATEGLSDIQAAGALLEKMVPEQRTPGSGPMSDADIKMFRASLPRLLNQPGGNQLIFQTLRGIATYEQQMGEIADMVADRAISPAEGRKRIRELANPLAEVKMPDGPTPNEGWTEITPGVRVRKKAD